MGLATGHAFCEPTQLTMHEPPEHNLPDVHLVPQPPQLAGSVCRFVQNAPAPEPQALGVAAGQAQALELHCCPDGHLVPQPPQLLASLVVSAQ